MVTATEFKNWALALEGAEEKPHFHLLSFRVKNKIFATFWEKENRAMLKLSPVAQSVFCSTDAAVFWPVPGTWGAKGATFVELSKVKKAIFKDALKTAHRELMNKK